jgi:hypothetical protein
LYIREEGFEGGFPGSAIDVVTTGKGACLRLLPFVVYEFVAAISGTELLAVNCCDKDGWRASEKEKKKKTWTVRKTH